MVTDSNLRWTQDDWDTKPGQSTSPVRVFAQRHGWLVRGAIIVLALILFELTADAAVSTAVSCLELGRTDLATALWLRRTDPDRSRGRLGALCYLIQALVRVGITALVTLILIGVWIGRANRIRPFPPLPPHFLGAGVVWLLAFDLAALLALVVCAVALGTGRRLWFGPEPSLARRKGVWPPSRVATGRLPANQGELVLIYPLVVAWLQAGVALTLAGAQGLIAIDFDRQMGLLGGLFVLLMVLHYVVKNRVLARYIEQCWPLREEFAVGSPTS